MEEVKEVKKKTNIWPLIVVAIIVGVIILFFWSCIFMCSGTSDKPSESNLSITAFVASQTYAKNYLKNPGSAKWPNIASSGVVVEKKSGNTYIVKSYVDSQNDFGALKRSSYLCTVEVYDINSYTVTDFLIKQD